MATPATPPARDVARARARLAVPRVATVRARRIITAKSRTCRHLTQHVARGLVGAGPTRAAMTGGEALRVVCALLVANIPCHERQQRRGTARGSSAHATPHAWRAEAARRRKPPTAARRTLGHRATRLGRAVPHRATGSSARRRTPGGWRRRRRGPAAAGAGGTRRSGSARAAAARAQAAAEAEPSSSYHAAHNPNLPGCCARARRAARTRRAQLSGVARRGTARSPHAHAIVGPMCMRGARALARQVRPRRVHGAATSLRRRVPGHGPPRLPPSLARAPVAHLEAGSGHLVRQRANLAFLL